MAVEFPDWTRFVVLVLIADGDFECHWNLDSMLFVYSYSRVYEYMYAALLCIVTTLVKYMYK